MILISLKIAILVAAFKTCQDGSLKRPLGLGVALAIFFSLFSLPGLLVAPLVSLAELVLGLLLCPLVMFLYWKNDRLVSSLAVAGIGSIVLVLVGKHDAERREPTIVE